MMDDNKNTVNIQEASKVSQKEHWELKSSSTMNGKDYDYEFPKTFEGFGYKFNEFGKLQHITTGEPFHFNEREFDHVYNQMRYEALGELVTDCVYNLLIEAGLKKLTLPIDADESEPTTVVFHTADAFTNEKLVILIHGSGVVRAGQWARRLIINDCLNTGTQLPFIKRSIGLGYGVLVLNTNDNNIEINGEIHKIRGSETAENHANYVWKNLILSKAAAKYIAIVAHSYGGIVAVNMCKTFPESFQQRIIAVAFTDSPHSLAAQSVPQPLIDWLRKAYKHANRNTFPSYPVKIVSYEPFPDLVEVSRNWVSSSKPLDTPLILNDLQEVECYSAGTQRHDMTSWMSFSSIFEFIDAKYLRSVGQDALGNALRLLR